MAIKNNQKIIFFLFSLFLVVALTACGSGDFTSHSSEQGSFSHDGTNLNVDFPVPKFLALSDSVKDSLKAVATIDNGSPHPLTVDPNTGQISGTITGVPSGNHTLSIIYFVSTSSGNVVLCSYSTQVSVWPGQATTVNIQDTDLDRNIDKDHDGYTNLAEVNIGTDPLLDTSVPPGESPYVMCGNGITNLVSSTNFNLAVVVGSAFAGTVESANYKIIISSAVINKAGTSLFLTK